MRIASRGSVSTHVARKGVTGVTSPLDLLDGLRPEDVDAAVAASRQLQSAASGRAH